MRLSQAIVNAKADLLGTRLNNGYLRLYSGKQPSTPEVNASDQRLLAELRFGNPAFLPAEAGLIRATSMSAEKKAKATGKASWFRCFAADGTTAVLDGSIGTAGCDMNLNSVDIQENAEVSLDSFVHDEND